MDGLEYSNEEFGYINGVTLTGRFNHTGQALTVDADEMFSPHRELG